MLVLDDVHAYYGDSHILQGVTLSVGEGEVVALLGRNGAGKTTTMRAVMGLTRARTGHIRLVDTDITRLPTYRIARHGVGYVPSGRRVFSTLTTRQCLELAGRRARWQPGGDGSWTLDRVLSVFSKLAELADRRAGLLSGGEVQMLKLAQALLRNPRVLLLDEPSEGLAPAVVADMGRWISVLREAGMSVLLTEQNVHFALKTADRGYILGRGRVQLEADAAALARSTELQQHLGVGAETDVRHV